MPDPAPASTPSPSAASPDAEASAHADASNAAGSAADGLTPVPALTPSPDAAASAHADAGNAAGSSADGPSATGPAATGPAPASVPSPSSPAASPARSPSAAAPKASTYQCPNCNGVLAFNVESGRLVCEYCGHAFDEGEFERAIPLGGTEIERGETAHVRSVEGFLEQAPWRVASDGYANALTYACPSCGAGVIADQSTVSTACPYCGNAMLVQGISAASGIPAFVMPFTLTREQAESSVRRHFRHKLYLSRTFNAHLEHLQGVYVPYHLFDLRVSGWANYIGRHEPVDAKGQKILVSHLAMRRAGRADISMLPVDGSAKMPDAHMDAIAPFDFGKLRPFSAEYLPGFLAEVPDENAETCLPRVEKRVRSDFEEKLADDAKRNPKVDALGVTSHKTTIEVVNARTCLLPVWLMHCTWEGHDMLFAVNGDSGKCVGDLPVSRARRVVTMIVGFAVSLALSWPLFATLFADDDMPGIMYLVAFAILLSPLAFDAFFMAQMHTATEAESDGMDYSTTGLVITESWDGPKFHLNRDKAIADLKARPRNPDQQ